MLSKKCLLDCLIWAKEKGLHLTCDEIYASSLFEGNQMISLALVWHELIKSKKNDAKWQNYLKNCVHITGGLSKDFGLSGFRIGITYTLNEEI